MTRKGPTLSAHSVRTCGTCGRALPRRAYRAQCASCRKVAAGWTQQTATRRVRGRPVARVIWVAPSAKSAKEDGAA